MMAVVALSYAAELADVGWQDMELASRCHALAAQINAGIEKYGIVEHPKYGESMRMKRTASAITI